MKIILSYLYSLGNNHNFNFKMEKESDVDFSQIFIVAKYI